MRAFPAIYVSTRNAKQTINAPPIANPSSPSVRFTALELPTMVIDARTIPTAAPPAPLRIGCLMKGTITSLISEVMVPFIKHPILSGAGGAAVGIVLASMTIVGSSNAVNLTDGLDGLAIGGALIVCFAFLVLTYMAGNARMAEYLQIPYVHGASELTVFCAAMIGAGLGFLWFNCHPAQVFMGDTGSLALGGALGIVAVLIHQPLVLVIAGGGFVLEAGSVMVQKGWFKYTRHRDGEGRRVFFIDRESVV